MARIYSFDLPFSSEMRTSGTENSLDGEEVRIALTTELATDDHTGEQACPSIIRHRE